MKSVVAAYAKAQREALLWPDAHGLIIDEEQSGTGISSSMLARMIAIVLQVLSSGWARTLHSSVV